MTWTAEYRTAVETGSDAWVPANGGQEEPVAYPTGTYLYVYNPARGEHRLYDLSSDIVLSAAETLRVLTTGRV